LVGIIFLLLYIFALYKEKNYFCNSKHKVREDGRIVGEEVWQEKIHNR
jgi:hypothetical protein